MLFTTATFIAFYLTVYLLFWSGSGRRYRLSLLLVASILFYAAWSIGFAIHFLCVVVCNYFIVQNIRRDAGRRWIFAALLFNGTNLFVFKYFYFFLSVLFDLTGNPIFRDTAFDRTLYETTGIHRIILPLAISFYTFQLIAYAIDVYRKKIEEPETLLEFMVFILFFPQLVAGPILRHSEFFGQLRSIDRLVPARSQITGGLFLLLSGYFKKILIADNLAPFTTPVFQNPSSYDWSAAVIACLGFAAQLYCDFSGYTDIARGLAKLFALEIPENFFSPYFSRSVRELWNNWHRTLTFWLRDYVYIPLGGQRVSLARAQFNIILTMTLCGLWHGASYNYLFLGIYHGVLIAIESTWNRLTVNRFARLPDSTAAKRLLDAGRMLIVFFLLCSGFVLFNTPDLTTAIDMYRGILTLRTGAPPDSFVPFVAGIVATLVFHIVQTIRWNLSERTTLFLLFLCSLFFVISLGRFMPNGQDFFYFQF